MKKLLLFVVIISSVLACQDNQRNLLYDQVMAVHDEAMPKMGAIKSMKKDLNNHIKQDSTINDSTLLVIKEKVQALEKSGRAMEDWMIQFKKPAQEESNEAAKTYYQDQIKIMTEVKDLMFNSLEEGQKLKEELGLK